jgi:hypothetical protein
LEKSTLLAPVSLGRMPLLEVETALQQGDNSKLWALANTGIQQDVFFDAVRTHVFNMTTLKKTEKTAATLKNCSMFMWPVVFEKSDWNQILKKLTNDDGASFLNTVESLSNWMNFKVDVGMLKTPLSYQFLVGQDPVEIRKFLDALCQRTSVDAIGVETPGLQLPADAPQLAFYVGSMTKEGSWPVLPAAASGSTFDLSRRLHSTINFVTQNAKQDDGFVVGVPELADKAMVSGLRLWLASLHKKYEFGRWDVVTCGGDRIDLSIELKNCEQSDARIPLRGYQIGMDGIESLVQESKHLGDEGVTGHGIWAN